MWSRRVFVALVIPFLLVGCSTEAERSERARFPGIDATSTSPKRGDSDTPDAGGSSRAAQVPAEGSAGGATGEPPQTTRSTGRRPASTTTAAASSRAKTGGSSRGSPAPTTFATIPAETTDGLRNLIDRLVVAKGVAVDDGRRSCLGGAILDRISESSIGFVADMNVESYPTGLVADLNAALAACLSPAELAQVRL